MSTRNSLSAIFATTILLILGVEADAQTTEQAAREQAREVVRSELQSTVNFKADQFLGISRDEELEKSLAIATIGWRVGREFVYKASATGVEIKENAIVDHVATDADSTYIVVVSSEDGSIFRIHGFGLAESLFEFERLMTALKVHVASPQQAESLADFYRKVNPENHAGLTPVTSVWCMVEACTAALRGSSFPTGGCPSRQRLSR